jgi:hypothetical protein
LLTFCTVPHAAQFAPTICANLRWQPLQLLMVGPDAISLIVQSLASLRRDLEEELALLAETLTTASITGVPMKVTRGSGRTGIPEGSGLRSSRRRTPCLISTGQTALDRRHSKYCRSF